MESGTSDPSSRTPSGPSADAATTALILLEMQPGVLGADSVVPDVARAARAAGMIERCARLTGAARRRGMPVIHTTVGARADFSGAPTNAPILRPALRAPASIVGGSVGALPLPESVGPGDRVRARATGLSPFGGKDLDLELRTLRIDSAVLVGVSLNLAVLCAAFDAVNLGYRVVIPRDAVLAIPVEYGTWIFQHTLGALAGLTDVDTLAQPWDRDSLFP